MSSNIDLTPSAIDELDADTSGPVLTADDDGYDEARRVWNGRFDRHPAVVVECQDRTDVETVVEFARSRDQPLAVKGGGHDYGGNPARDDSVLLDCSPMDSVDVDPDTRTARVGAGVTWATFDEQAQEFDLATTGATVSSVGVAGYTLGGGTGHLARTHGLAVDNLRAAEIVTADGETVRASEDEHSDLFWAIRGGSGNFGVVTEFEFDLHPVGPEVLAGQIVHPFEDAREVLRHYRRFMADAPAAVNCYAFVIPIPPIPAFPEERHGDPAIDLVASYSGEIEAGEDALAPLRDFGEPILDSVRPQPYTEFQQAFDDGAPKGERWYSRALYLDELTEDAIDAFVDATDPLRGPMTMVYLEPMGGAISAVDPDATAFPHRDAAYSVHALTGWSDPERDAELIDWTDSVYETMVPHSSGGVYVNLLNREETDRVPEAYGENHERLRELKAEWDPENRFDSNQNIEPAA